jgi:hypothetical protein
MQIADNRSVGELLEARLTGREATLIIRIVTEA